MLHHKSCSQHCSFLKHALIQLLSSRAQTDHEAHICLCICTPHEVYSALVRYHSDIDERHNRRRCYSYSEDRCGYNVNCCIDQQTSRFITSREVFHISDSVIIADERDTATRRYTDICLMLLLTCRI